MMQQGVLQEPLGGSTILFSDRTPILHSFSALGRESRLLGELNRFIDVNTALETGGKLSQPDMQETGINISVDFPWLCYPRVPSHRVLRELGEGVFFLPGMNGGGKRGG